MTIKLLCIGKTDEQYLQQGISIYEKRLKHYINYEEIIIPHLKNIKNLSPEEIKEKEAELLLNQFDKANYIILLDEAGKDFRSVEFSGFLQKQMNSGIKTLMFVIGGAFGFSDKIYQQAHMKLSISPMTFSHQMIRLLFIEQLYRAFTILNNEPYHNE